MAAVGSGGAGGLGDVWRTLAAVLYLGEVAFEPVQMKTWQDTRPYANTPWSPPFELPAVPDDGKWEVTATFDEPGTYVLRALAGDGALFSWQDAVITVDP